MSDWPGRATGGREQVIGEELLAYLRQHPHAMDTLEGIAAWWLPRHEVRVGVERVARALELLEERGLIERVGEAERPLFRLCAPLPDGSHTGATND